VLAESGIKDLPKAKRVVLVGNRISPGNPVVKTDGTVVRTLWGEIAWQLGGKKAFARVKADDEKATNPGDTMRELFKEYGPCLVLIDEWVAYARQLHEQSDLPAGSFETQFTFAQALTESAKLAGNCLIVISLPASDTQGSPHTQADDAEVGGLRGREALERSGERDYDLVFMDCQMPGMSATCIKRSAAAVSSPAISGAIATLERKYAAP